MKKIACLFSFFLLLIFIPSAQAKSAVAVLHGTKPDSTVSGEVHFYQTDKGLKIMAHVEGVPAGDHGIHVHEKGDCGDFGNAAGGHFNPEAQPHGDVVKDGIAHCHGGDLGNIVVGADGKGDLEKVVPGLTLDPGKYSVAGRSVILHEKKDDFGQPTGNAGGRIGCAEIPS